MISNEDEPMIARDRSKGVPIPVEAVAQIAMAVKVVKLLVEATVGEHLIAREGEVLPTVPQPVDLESYLTPETDEGGHATEEGRRTARLEHDHVGIDEERTLAQHISVEVTVRHLREDGAASTHADAVDIRTGKDAKTGADDGITTKGGFALKLRVLTVWFNLTKANLWKQKLGKEGLDHILFRKIKRRGARSLTKSLLGAFENTAVIPKDARSRMVILNLVRLLRLHQIKDRPHYGGRRRGRASIRGGVPIVARHD